MPLPGRSGTGTLRSADHECARRGSPVMCRLLLGGYGNDEPAATTIDLSKRGEVMIDRPDHAITYAYLPQYAHAVSYARRHLAI